MGGFVVFLVIAGGFVGLIAWGMHHAKTIRLRWQGFAQQHGLQYSGGTSATSSPHIAGWYGRTHVTINTVTRGSGKNRHTYTQFHGQINVAMPQGLNLTREGLFNKVSKFFGGQDVQLGDRQLDDAFIIKAHDAMGAFNLMRIAQVKQALLTFVARHPTMQLNERHLMFEESGTCADMIRMKAAIDDLAYLGQTIEAGYQELLGAKGAAPVAGASGPTQLRSPQSRVRSAPTMPVVNVADILGAPANPMAGVYAAQKVRQEASAQAAQARNNAQAAEARALNEQEVAQRQSEADARMGALRAQREAKVREQSADAEARRTIDQTGARALPSDSQRRQPAESAALGSLAGAFHALESKMQDAGAWTAQDVAKEGKFISSGQGAGDAFAVRAEGDFSAGNAADAFKVSSGGSAFDVPPAGDAFKASSWQPTKYETPKFESAKFETKADAFTVNAAYTPPTQPAKSAPVLDIASFDQLVAKLGEAGMFSGERDKLMDQVQDRVFIFEIQVERVERTFSFDLPDKLRDGRTIEGKIVGKDIRVAARFPASDNEKLDRVQGGVKLEVQGCLAKWDDLFKKATLNAF